MSSRIRRSPRERLAAWVVTGPLGHLYGTTADLTVLWLRYGRHRARLALRGGDRDDSGGGATSA